MTRIGPPSGSSKLSDLMKSKLTSQLASRSAAFQNNQTGDIVRAPEDSPIATNQNFSNLDNTIAKPGQSPLSGQGQTGTPAFIDVRGAGAVDTATGIRNLGQGGPTRVNTPVIPGFGSGVGLSGASAGTSNAGSETGPQLGGEIASDVIFDLPESLQKQFKLPGSEGPTAFGLPMIDPQQVALGQLQTSLGLGGEQLTNAIDDFTGTTQLATGQAQQNIDLIREQAQIGEAQAQREKELGLASIDVQEQQAEIEYNQAVSQIQTNRERENEYLKQKLASAGATNSTAGVTILSRSAEKYDEIFGNLAGQRQVSLAQFSIAESEVRNRYTSAVENITLQANQLTTQLGQALQQTLLSAQQQLGDIRTRVSGNQSQAYQDYFQSLFNIQQAQVEAEAEAQQAALELQQQAFDNSIRLGQLTGTYTDPVTGESIRTLNGQKFDLQMLEFQMDQAGGGSTSIGNMSDEQAQNSLLSAMTTAFDMGIIDDAKRNEIIADISTSQSGEGSRAKFWLGLLNNQITGAQGQIGEIPLVLSPDSRAGEVQPIIEEFSLISDESRYKNALEAATADGKFKREERNQLRNQFPAFATDINETFDAF